MKRKFSTRGKPIMSNLTKWRRNSSMQISLVSEKQYEKFRLLLIWAKQFVMHLGFISVPLKTYE